MNINKVVNHWIQTSDEDFIAMQSLYKSKVYHWSLFLGHITIEKLLKALYVKTNLKHAIFTHNLFRLAELCSLEISEDIADDLTTITTFNINARYDDYKKEFYQKCSKEYTENWIQKIKEIRKWLKQKL
ncbi:MAG: DNA-binding protein [Bacteroidetes bacterium GWA2_31_9]|nr:MAG: DNA-binding protein [Bacteroidetes bacterium GWA2_31_9]